MRCRTAIYTNYLPYPLLYTYAQVAHTRTLGVSVSHVAGPRGRGTRVYATRTKIFFHNKRVKTSQLFTVFLLELLDLPIKPPLLRLVFSRADTASLLHALVAKLCGQ